MTISTNFTPISISLLIAIAPAVAFAQANPANPGGFNNTDPRSPAYNPGNNVPPQSLRDSGKWVSRWGAIAADVPNSKLGAITGMHTRKAAERGALSKCSEEGGVNCEIEVYYSNQCAVLVSGDTKFTTAVAVSVEDASVDAFNRCRRVDSGCRLHYSGCSAPEKVY